MGKTAQCRGSSFSFSLSLFLPFPFFYSIQRRRVGEPEALRLRSVLGDSLLAGDRSALNSNGVARAEGEDFSLHTQVEERVGSYF